MKRRIAFNPTVLSVTAMFHRIQARGGIVRSFATRSNGYVFWLVQNKHGVFRVWAGCRRNWSMAHWRKHVRGYKGSFSSTQYAARKAKETTKILDLFQEQISKGLR